MREFENSEGSSVLRSCQFSCRRKKRFKSIRFSSSSRRWERGTIDEEEEEISYLQDDDSSSIFEPNFKKQKNAKEEEFCCYLADELVTEILEWLPIKSIVRFRLVSKSWSALFKTPDFIRNHRLKQQRTKSGTMLLLRRRYTPPHSHHDVISFHDLDSPEREVRDRIPILWRLKNLVGKVTMQFRMLGPVNGIICIFNAFRFILCNLALHEFKLLPPIPWAATPAGYRKSFSGSGFGVSSSEDFKVIVFFRFKNRIDNQTWLPYVVAYLYNSRTNSWRQFQNSTVSPVMPFHTDVTVLNGAWHWAGKILSSQRKVIVSFDVTSEVFGQLELPDWGFSLSFPNVVVLNNCLGVLHYKKRFSNSEPVEIWVMKEYGVKESWSKLFVINPQPIATAFLPWKSDTMFLLQQPGLEIAERTPRKAKIIDFDSAFNAQLTSINLRTSELKEFQVFGADRTLHGLIYEESLVSLN